MNIKSDTKPIIKEVVDKHEVVEKRQKSLTAGASILVKLAVGISMMYVNPVSGFMNLSGTTAVVTNAGFSSLCADASKSLIENNGDPSKAIKDLSNKQTAINIGKSMISSGLVHEISNVVGVTPTKELTEYAKKAAITSAVNTVLSTSIDGQPLNKALEEGLKRALILTGSSYLAGQIGELKPEIGDVNHKILHGLLGGVSGGITSKLFGGSFESGVISGAMGAVIAETVAEMLQDDVNTVMAEGAKKGKTLNQLQEEFMEKAKRSSKWGDFIAVVAALGTGGDASIANETAANATSNNNLGKTCAIALSVIAEQFGVWESVYAIGLSGGVKALLDSIKIKSLEGDKFSFNHIQYLSLEDVLRVAIKGVAPVTSIVARTVANMMDIDLSKPKVNSTPIHQEKPLILTTPVVNIKTINEGFDINQEKIVNEGFKGYDGPDTSVLDMANGRSGRQQKLKELALDEKVSSADRGWIKQELNAIESGQRKNIRNPIGKDLAHKRGFEAAKGFDYSYSHLQSRDLHRLQHKFDENGKKNKTPSDGLKEKGDKS